jgi:ferric-chelate reductase
MVAKFSVQSLLVLLSLFQYGLSETITYNHFTRVALACNYQIILTVLFCPPTQLDCAWTNKNSLATFMGCVEHYDVNMDSFVNFVIPYLENVFLANVTKEQLFDAWLYYNSSAVPISDIPNFNISVPVDQPVILDEDERRLMAKAYDKFLGNYNVSLYYSAGLLGYWLVILLIAMVANWSKVLFPGLVFKFTGPLVNKYRQYVTIPAIHRKRNQTKTLLGMFDFILIPSRYESLVILGFVVLVVAFNGHMYKWSPDDMLFSLKSEALSRYIGDRSGITGTFLVPLFILFAGRNNIMMFVTRLHFSTFITFHKWIARLSTLLIFIHSVAWTICLGHTYASEAAETYMIWGILATVVMCLMMGQAFLMLRRLWYETFVLLHILLSALFVAGTWLHVVTLGYGPVMYATVAVWVFDRVVRIARMLWFGVSKASVTLVSNETLRIVVPKPAWWKTIPGGYAFIYFMRPSCFWQSHPFTFTEHPSDPNQVVMYCKVKGGVTHGLYQYLAKFPDQTATIKVVLEGPYGDLAPVERCDQAVFVAGGNGIPGIYSEVVELVRKKKHEDQVIKLYWVIREYKSLLWFHEELLYLKNTNVETVVYVTDPSSATYFSGLKEVASNVDSDKKSENDSSDIASFESFKSQFDHVEFREGRPDINKLVVDEIEESKGSIAFVTCGNPTMVDDLRYCIADNVTNFPKKRVDFYEQLEVWA